MAPVKSPAAAKPQTATIHDVRFTVNHASRLTVNEEHLRFGSPFTFVSVKPSAPSEFATHLRVDQDRFKAYPFVTMRHGPGADRWLADVLAAATAAHEARNVGLGGQSPTPPEDHFINISVEPGGEHDRHLRSLGFRTTSRQDPLDSPLKELNYLITLAELKRALAK